MRICGALSHDATLYLNLADSARALRAYAATNALDNSGPVCLRPWRLPWYPECGLKGVADPAAKLKLDSI